MLAARPTPLVEVRPQGGSAAHRGAHRRYLAVRVDSRGACAAVGGIRWWNSCRRSTRCHSSTKLSPCPTSLWTESHSLLRVVVRAGQNRWWKCLRSYPTLLDSSELPSRSLTFQFLRVVAIEAAAGEGGLQGLRPRQNSTALGGALHVDIPVPHGRGGRVGQGGLQGFSPGRGSTAFSGADLVDIPVPRGGGFTDLFLLLHPRTRLVLWLRLLEGFSHFSPHEKVRSWVRTRGRN